MNGSRVIAYLGMVLLFLTAFMATSLPWAWLDEGVAGLRAWAWPIASTTAAGAAMVLLGRRRPKVPRHRRVVDGRAAVDPELSRREALAIVTFSWVFCGIFGGLPFLSTGMVDHPIDAFFETISGVTTTGSTILTEIEGQSRAGLWWRSLLQWLGGMGIIVLFVALFPQSGGGGRKLYQGEAPGPEKGQLRPRVAETSAVLWRIYAGITALAIGAFLLEGMTFHEAACHAFSTLATGGFSTRNTSIASFDSALIEGTVTVFMLLAGCNFGIYYALTRRFELRVLRDPELLAYLGLVAAAMAAVTLVLLPSEGSLTAAFRVASFQVASLATSTGFGTADYTLWPAIAQTILLTLMFIGSMGGSTGGGFKISRLLILTQTTRQEVRRVLHPHAVFTTRLGSRPLDEKVVRSVFAIFVLAIGSLLFGTLALTLCGLEMEDAFAACLTAIANSGPALGPHGPAGNFASVPQIGKLLLAILMIVGRLEFFTALVLLTPGFWRGR